MDPALHNFNLKTTRVQEMTEWSALVVGSEVTLRDAKGAWLTHDQVGDELHTED